VRGGAGLLREPISLILVIAIAASAVVSVFARQDLQAAYQADVARALGEARPRLQTMGGALSDFEHGGIGEDLFRTTLSTAERGTAEALEPLSTMPELRGTFLDEPDAAAHHTSLALRGELDELDAVLQQHEPLPQVVYRAQRVLSLAGPSASGLSVTGSSASGLSLTASGASPVGASAGGLALDPVALGSAHRLWLETYARELTSIDGDLQAQVDDLSRWRSQTLPNLASRNQWADVRTRLAAARTDLQLAQDRLRALPAPPEALRPLADYTTALGHLDRALQALTTYADARTPAPLQTGDQELAAYQSTRQPALNALTALGR
jgi:hypothetical protein